MGFGISTNVPLFVVILFTLYAQVMMIHNNSLIAAGIAPIIPVVVDIVSNIGKPGALLYNRESNAEINLKYYINCTSYDAVYTVLATTSAENIAILTDNSIFNISCDDLRNSNNSEDGQDLKAVGVGEATENGVIGTVAGEVNITLKARMIGRAFLMLFAHKTSGFDRHGTNQSKDEDVKSFSYRLDNLATRGGRRSNDSTNSAVSRNRSQGYDLHGLPPNVVGRAMIIVMQLPRTVDEVFRIVLYVVIVLATVGMGVKVDLQVIKQVLRKPIAPIIGLFCQYICMPLIAFLVTRIVPQDSAALSLGIYACGIVPGGGPSNMFSYLLGGDLSLSVTMTTLSNIASLGMLPLWIFTLGDTFKDDTIQLHVPYEKILEALAIVILPLFVGFFVKYKLPKVAKIIGIILKPVLLIIVTFTISFGIYVNIFIFEMIRPMTIIAGCLLPYIGYLLGGFISFICFRSWTHIKTIAIETGIQNTSIAFLILFLSLPPPDNQLAAVGPAASAIMTPLPLFVAVLLYIIYQRCFNKPEAKASTITDGKLENGDIDKKEDENVVKEDTKNEETAAILLVWWKLTKQDHKKKVVNVALSKELEIMLPEKENLM